ncbi:MAG: single-stranded-DNA-specific exonuclease RecJ, partial [Methylobacter sp.]
MYYHGVKKVIEIRPLVKKRAQLGEIHPILERILLARGVGSQEELDRTLAKLPSPWLLSGMEEMVAHLTSALEKRQ